MNISTFYDYLVQARRPLWAALETLPDDSLAKDVLPGDRFHSAKDLIAHIPAVEDSWLHEDILGDTPVWSDFAFFAGKTEGASYAAVALSELLEYWQAVETSTLGYLANLNDADLKRDVTVQGRSGEEHFSTEHILWHVMQHEVRHTAQLAMLMRLAGQTPPRLDLIDFELRR